MTLKEVKMKLINNEFEQTFSKLYGENLAKRQKERYLSALEDFKNYFNADDNTSVAIYSAPGRTEIAGNHTDHQHGRVIAASVNLDAIGIVAKAKEGTVRVKSSGYEESAVDIYDLDIHEDEKNTSAALIRGIMANFKSSGLEIGGFCAYITSEVLTGSGLSSSAAFETLIGTILSHEFNGGAVDAVKIALAGQYAENTYFGKPCGLMDQLASSAGGILTIDFKDPKNPEMQKINLDLQEQKHTLCVVDTGGNHADLTADYASIPAEMKEAAKLLGCEVLGDASEETFYERIPLIRKTCGDRAVVRAMHFFMENENVRNLTMALNNRDFESFLRLIRKSGRSSFCYLQNVFTTKMPSEQGLSVALAVSEAIMGDQGAFRVHGGGFAGTILAFVPDELLNSYIGTMNGIFGENACHRLHLRQTGACRII